MPIDSRVEKKIITGMIMSTRFLQEIQPIFRPLRVPFANTIAGWSNTYYEKYRQAPQRHIQDLYIAHSGNGRMDEDSKELISEFLHGLSDEYSRAKKFNVNYVLDSAEKYFRILSIEELKAKLTQNLLKGDIDKAENNVKGYERVVRPETEGVNPFARDIIRKAFDRRTGGALFNFPGTLGRAVGKFEREQLVAFIGKAGIGKTWWLMWIAILGVFEGYNVVFVSLEMSEEQMIQRIHQHINAKPVDDEEEVSIPMFDEDYEIEYKTVRRKSLCDSVSIKKINAIMESGILSRKDNFRVLFYPSNTVPVSTLEIQLQNMEYYDGFIPDIIVTDYADKFKAETKMFERRHQLAQIWGAHKAMAQKRKCLVVTASQSNTMRTGKDIRQGDWAESIEKINEIDIGLALNQKPEQKRDGYMRVGILKQRFHRFDLLREVTVLQSYDIGRPYLDSHVYTKKEKKEE